MRILLVEDDGSRISWFKYTNIGRILDITKDVKEAKRLIDANDYDQIYLDHDLADEHYAVWREGSNVHDETTGYAVAKHLAENRDRSPRAKITIHSLNPHGAERMYRKLKDAQRNVHKTDFLQLTHTI